MCPSFAKGIPFFPGSPGVISVMHISPRYLPGFFSGVGGWERCEIEESSFFSSLKELIFRGLSEKCCFIFSL